MYVDSIDRNTHRVRVAPRPGAVPGPWVSADDLEFPHGMFVMAPAVPRAQAVKRGDRNIFYNQRWDGYKWVSEAEYAQLERRLRGETPTVRCPAPAPKCECGGESVGAGHSGWCPKGAPCP